MKKWLLPFAMLCWQMGVAQQSMTKDKSRKDFIDALGHLYGAGKSYDPQKGVQILKQGAISGDCRSLNALGNLYAAGGAGLKRDIIAAIDYYKRSGAAGCIAAYYNLAILYKEGKILSQDFEQSAYYLNIGTKLGDQNCKKLLAYYYFKGFGVQQDYKQAFNLYQELAAIGDANAQYFLGLCYRNGYGTRIDQTQAKKWLMQAASQGDNQAVHELTAEPQPENSNIQDPGLQQQVEKLKNYQEQLIAANSNDISGSYKGFAVYYDFSGKFVHQVTPLTLTLDRTQEGYKGTWTEGDSLVASIRGFLNNSHLKFDSNSKYTRRNYYSYRQAEDYQFKSAQLSVNYIKDSMCLNGSMQFYSLSRREPGQPMYIMLSKKVSGDGTALNESLQLIITPNPAASEVKASFNLNIPGKVSFDIVNMEGKVVINKNSEALLPVGSYSFPIDIKYLTHGSYILRMRTSTGAMQVKKFIKL